MEQIRLVSIQPEVSEQHRVFYHDIQMIKMDTASTGGYHAVNEAVNLEELSAADFEYTVESTVQATELPRSKDCQPAEFNQAQEYLIVNQNPPEQTMVMQVEQ